MQENTASHFGMVAVEAVSNDIHRCNAGAYIFGLHGDATNLPAILDLQFKLRSTEADNLAYCLFQVALAGADQQEIIHVAEIMRYPVCTLSAPEFTHILLDVVIQRLQKKVGEPLRRVCPDGDASRDAVYDIVCHIQHTGVLNDTPKSRFQ